MFDVKDDLEKFQYKSEKKIYKFYNAIIVWESSPWPRITTQGIQTTPMMVWSKMPLKFFLKKQVFHLQDTTIIDDLWSSIYFYGVKYSTERSSIPTRCLVFAILDIWGVKYPIQ